MNSKAGTSDPHAAFSELQLRQQVRDAMHTMHRLRLNVGTAGNASARFRDGMLISPSGVAPIQLAPEDIAFRQFVGRDDVPGSEVTAGEATGRRASSEWRLHQAVLLARPDVGAITHCHSRYATILACTRTPIPAIHYLVGLCGADQVPVTPYARFGSADLAAFTADALSGCDACLLANHGLVTCGKTVAQALALAEEIEELAAIHWHALAIGGGTVLEKDEMTAVIADLDAYRTT